MVGSKQRYFPKNGVSMRTRSKVLEGTNRRLRHLSVSELVILSLDSWTCVPMCQRCLIARARLSVRLVS